MLNSIRLSDLVMIIEYQVSVTHRDMSDPSPPRQIVYKSIQFSHFLYYKAYAYLRIGHEFSSLAESFSQQSASAWVVGRVSFTGTAVRNSSSTGRSKLSLAQAMKLRRSVLLTPPMGFRSLRRKS